jgi:Transcription factor WhiB
MTAAKILPAPACWGVDPELFFGPADSSAGQALFDWERQALSVCAGCRVQVTCLAAALEFPADEQHGVIGGMAAVQRRALLRASRQRPTRSSVTDTTNNRQRLVQATIRLRKAGHGPREIAARLQVGERRWLAAHRAEGVA